MKRVDLIAPDAEGRKRWTRSLVDLSQFGIDEPYSEANQLDVAVDSDSSRIRMRHAQSTQYASGKVLPPRSFIEVAPGLAISCPELLFIEMATVMHTPEHLMLGHELCGAFSRDPRDPLNGPVALHLEPVTSKDRIAEFLAKTRWLPGAEQSRRTLELLADNAWSPTESLVAALASLPMPEFGYGLGPCVLNERIDPSETLSGWTEARWRTPDILFGDTRVGINYDGAVHLDLDAVVDAAMEVGRDPGSQATGAELERAVREVRAKVVDDIRRNRELAASGYAVFPVVKEDLYEEGGLDRVMMQVIEALEKHAGRDMSKQRRLMKNKFLRVRRQELIWSLLPGRHRTLAAGREEAIPYLRLPSKVIEVRLGF